MVRTKEQFDEAYRLLESDLRSLFKLVFTHRKPLAEGDIRLASVTLRKWLIGGMLGQLCRHGGTKATLLALDNDAFLQAVAREPSINYCVTAGVRMNGLPVQGIYNSKLPFSGRPPLQTPMEPIELPLGQFLKQKRLYFEGTFFTCEEIIKYTANKLGGAHLDFNRHGRLEILERAASFMTYGGPPVAEGSKPQSELYIILEPLSSEILSGLHLEIIAAAASLVQVRLGGKSLIELESRPTILSRLKRMLGSDRPGFRYGNYGDARVAAT